METVFRARVSTTKMASTIAAKSRSPISSESEGELFEVESIVGKRTRHGKVEYLVRWKGFGQSEDSWEPVKNLRGCQILIKKFSKTRSPSPGRKAKTPKKSQMTVLSQTKQDTVKEPFTKLKTPNTSTPTSECIILHRKGGPLSAKKQVKEEKEELIISEKVTIKQEKQKESITKETPPTETTSKDDSISKTIDGKQEVFKMVAALVVFTFVVLLLFSFIPGVGVFDMNN